MGKTKALRAALPESLHDETGAPWERTPASVTRALTLYLVWASRNQKDRGRASFRVHAF